MDPNLVKDVIKPTPVEVPVPSEKEKPSADRLGPRQYCWGTGRRKKSVARVRIRPGTGKININNRQIDEYFPNQRDRNDVRAPLQKTQA
ncbi:MAG: hypothetical protein AMJ79_09350, partial [Phycisphaerae bacterium SM23_30]